MTDTRHLNPESICNLLQQLGADPSIDSNGQIYVVFPADEDFNHDVAFLFTATDDGWFGVTAFADGFDIEPQKIHQAYMMANEFSIKAKLPKVFIQNERFKLEDWIMFPIGTSDDFIKKHIHMVMSVSWHFFVEAQHIMSQQ